MELGAGFAWSEWDEELEAGFELFGDERIDSGGLRGGAENREQIRRCSFWD